MNTAAVRRGDIQEWLKYSGEIRARQQVTVLPKASGRVEKLDAEVGQQVKAGDVIAVLDQDNPQMQILQARAGLPQAQARLASLQSGPRTEDVAAAQAALAQQQSKLQNMRTGGRAEDVRAAEAALSASGAKLQSLISKYPVDNPPGGGPLKWNRLASFPDHTTVSHGSGWRSPPA